MKALTFLLGLAVRGGAMRVQDDRTCSGAIRAKTGGHHQGTGRRGGFVRPADRRVLNAINENVALRRAAESQQRLIGHKIEFEQQIRRRQRGKKLGWTLQQRSARRGRAATSVHRAAPASAAGREQQHYDNIRRGSADLAHILGHHNVGPTPPPRAVPCHRGHAHEPKLADDSDTDRP